MKYLLWDIDGTLLLTGGAGMLALVQVIKAYYGLADFSFSRSLAGRTDLDIVKEVGLEVRGRYLPREGAALLRNYAAALPAALPQCQGRVLPNVEKTLAYVAGLPGWHNGLLTGNIKDGAALKLGYYGLWRYFAAEANFFGDLSPLRQEVARQAWRSLYEADPFLSPQDVVVIGDTPNDALCARAIGARSLILLAGSSYRQEDFAQVRPWLLLPALPEEPEDLVRLILAEEEV